MLRRACIGTGKRRITFGSRSGGGIDRQHRSCPKNPSVFDGVTPPTNVDVSLPIEAWGKDKRWCYRESDNQQRNGSIALSCLRHLGHSLLMWVGRSHCDYNRIRLSANSPASVKAPQVKLRETTARSIVPANQAIRICTPVSVDRRLQTPRTKLRDAARALPGLGQDPPEAIR